MRDKIRIELSSESRLGWEPFYAVLDLPATAQQIRDARQKARITGREDMTYQSISFLGFDPLPNLEHLRLDTTSVEELNYLAQRLDSLSDEQFIIYQALFDQRFGDVDSNELLSVKDLINMTYGLDSVMVASNIHNDEQLGSSSSKTTSTPMSLPSRMIRFTCWTSEGSESFSERMKAAC